MTARLEALRAEPDPEGADWEWRCRDGTIEGRRPGGEWIVVGNPSPRTIIDGVYIGHGTPARMALWWSLFREPYQRAA